jgi:diguanylate cyclase (GGDEF)-like protein
VCASAGRAWLARRAAKAGWRRTQLLEAALRRKNLQLEAGVNNMSQGLAVFDAQQCIVVANARYAQMYGLTPEQVKPGTNLRQILLDRAAKGAYADIDFEAFLREGLENFGRDVKQIIRLADGRVVSVVRVPLPDGGLISTHEDITEREMLHAKLTQQHEHLHAALTNMVQGLAMFDAAQRVVIVNRQYAEMYGLNFDQVRPGTTLRRIVEYRVANGECGGKKVEEVLESIRRSMAGPSQFVSRLANGRCIAVSTQRMADGGVVTTHQDITEQRRAEAKIVHMALHDTLTDLPNRALLNERLEYALTRVKCGEIIAMHMLDLDHFKAVNDTLGHPVGDKLLRMVSDRLCALVRENDTIARMGGDEFAVVQVGMIQPSDAAAQARGLIEAMGKPFEIDGHKVVVGTSIGIAVGPADGMTAEQLIKNADLALYAAKGEGGGTLCFFEPEMETHVLSRREMECDLRNALAGHEFVLFYQPVVELKSLTISGFEALIRWRHPRKGLIPPGAFIPLAEELGLIIPIGEWVVREACTTAARWPERFRIAVNLSPEQFRNPGLFNVIVAALAGSRLAPDRLELEITETTLLQDSELTLSILYRLRDLGVRIAMDDFGTGYSSLNYLQSFPFDKIKIDRAFVKDVADNAGSLNIVRAVAALAQGLGMAATAEGVETKQQLDIVTSEGCTEMQGFLFSEPLPAPEIERRFLTGRHRARALHKGADAA